MIVADLNLLLYAYDSLSPPHKLAKQWWIDVLAGPEAVGLCDVVIFGFIRITTRRGVYAQPLIISEALEIVRSWLSHPNVEILTPNSNTRATCFDLLASIGTGGNLTTDVQIAALALQSRAVVHSNDRDFLRFPGLKLVNPLEPQNR